MRVQIARFLTLMRTQSPKYRLCRRSCSSGPTYIYKSHARLMNKLREPFITSIFYLRVVSCEEHT